MPLSAHIVVIIFMSCGALVALATENYPLAASRLLEAALDALETAEHKLARSRLRGSALRREESAGIYAAPRSDSAPSRSEPSVLAGGGV